MSSFWTQRTVFSYTPASTPELTFYYVPLQGTQQLLHRQRYSEFDTTYDLMKHVFSQRLLLFKVEKEGADDPDQIFMWPNSDDSIQQEALFENIPRSVVIEAGAAILGWKRDTAEDAKQFVDRIVRDLRDAVSM